MIEFDHADLNVSKQSSLLDLNRTSLYYKPTILDDTELANQIHEIYLKNKCIYGYRKITAALHHNFGVISNRKKVARIMREMKIVGLYPRKRINTTIINSNQDCSTKSCVPHFSPLKPFTKNLANLSQTSCKPRNWISPFSVREIVEDDFRFNREFALGVEVSA